MMDDYNDYEDEEFDFDFDVTGYRFEPEYTDTELQEMDDKIAREERLKLRSPVRAYRKSVPNSILDRSAKKWTSWVRFMEDGPQIGSKNTGLRKAHHTGFAVGPGLKSYLNMYLKKFAKFLLSRPHSFGTSFLKTLLKKKTCETMNTFTPADFDFTFLEEGFCARDMVEQRINELSMSDDKDAFYVADLGDILKKHLRWVRAMPRVTPFYAVKCNDSRAVVMTLASLGTGFDCASKNEIELVQSLGVDPGRIIYANPCKEISHLKYASAHGVKTMTFDSEEELVKVARCHENAKLVLRIATDDSKAVYPLSVKFGAMLKSCRRLLERARELGLDIIGVSFHVGCGCTDPETYTQAISDARCVFDMGAELGYNMTLLDIGGGFPGSDDFKLKFEEFTAVINPALDKHFPADCGVQVIGEPGSYYVISAYMLAVNIIAKKVVMTEQSASDDEDDGAKDRTLMYYVNDGIYSSFNEVIFDPAYGLPRLHKKPKPDERTYPCSIWGQTCDGLDRIVEQCVLPDLQVGEWLLFNNMGAYSVTLSTTFNGFHKPDVHYVMSRSAWQHIQQISAQGLRAPVEEACPNGVPSCYN